MAEDMAEVFHGAKPCVVHEIVTDENGVRHGTDGEVTMTLLDPEGRMFKRRAIKGAGSGGAYEVCWLVAELNGVRVYQQGMNIVVTSKDLSP